jgi:hypothetical protein
MTVDPPSDPDPPEEVWRMEKEEEVTDTARIVRYRWVRVP